MSVFLWPIEREREYSTFLFSYIYGRIIDIIDTKTEYQ